MTSKKSSTKSKLSDELHDFFGSYWMFK